MILLRVDDFPGTKKMSNYFIYGLIDPITNEIKYIGRSSSGLRRPKAHWATSILKKEKNRYKKNWIQKILKNNLKPEIIVLESFEPCDHINEILNESEQFWIAYFSFIGAKLTNLTNGGGGILGLSHSNETKKKIGNSNKLSQIGLKRPWLYKIIKCIICNKEFHSRGRKRYCSQKCFKSVPCSEQKREKNKIASSGTSNPMYGKIRELNPRFGIKKEKHPLFGKKGDLCKNSKKVKCVETNEIFSSMREAAEHFGVSVSIISKNFLKKSGPVKGKYNFI